MNMIRKLTTTAGVWLGATAAVAADATAPTLSFTLSIDKVLVPAGMAVPEGFVVGRTLDARVRFVTALEAPGPAGLLQHQVYPGAVSRFETEGVLNVRFATAQLAVYPGRSSIGIAPRGCQWQQSVMPGLRCDHEGEVVMTTVSDGREVSFRPAFLAYMLEHQTSDGNASTAQVAVREFMAAAVANPGARLMLGLASEARLRRSDFDRSVAPEADWLKVILVVESVRASP